MTAPSNANTSGLEVVAWEYRYPDTEPWHKTMSKREADEEREDGSEVRPYAVTAASAQARIAELEACAQEEADTLASKLTTAEIVAALWKDRAAAAEARADRLAKALERRAGLRYADPDNLNWKVLDLAKRIARAALQQETQK